MTTIRKLTALFLGIVLWSAGFSTAQPLGTTFTDGPPAPEVISEALVLMDADSGTVLYEKNMESVFMPASTTKLLTAILAVEHLDMEEVITVGPKPPFAIGASMGFKEGEEVRVIDLLYSLIVHSANDAAEVLAEAISGSVEEFSVLMNEKAKSLGCTHSNFVNPSGLSDAEHVTTAKDMALITGAASDYPLLVEIGKTYSYMLPTTNLVSDINRWVTNKNGLLRRGSKYYYEPTVVAKTGWTGDAGFAHTASAEKDGKRFVVSILRAPNQDTYWTETIAMFEWAFENFTVKKLYEEGQVLRRLVLKNGDEVDLVAEEDFYYTAYDGGGRMDFELEYEEEVLPEGFIEAGAVASTAKVLINGEEAGVLNLLSTRDVLFDDPVDEEEPLGEAPEETPSEMLKAAGMVTGAFLVSALVLILAIRSVNRKRYRKKRLRRIIDERRMQEYKERDRYRR